MFYHSITEFVFLMNILGKRRNPQFLCKSDPKAWFPLPMSRILFAAKHSLTALCMSRPLFIGSYLQVMCGGLSANDKKENLLRMIIQIGY